MDNWRENKNQCPSCEALMINGVYSHETGCPDKWRNSIAVCPWCGTEFIPSEPFQLFCSEECGINYTT